MKYRARNRVRCQLVGHQAAQSLVLDRRKVSKIPIAPMVCEISHVPSELRQIHSTLQIRITPSSSPAARYWRSAHSMTRMLVTGESRRSATTDCSPVKGTPCNTSSNFCLPTVPLPVLHQHMEPERWGLTIYHEDRIQIQRPKHADIPALCFA